MSNHSYLNVIDKLLGSVDSTTDVFLVSYSVGFLIKLLLQYHILLVEFYPTVAIQTRSLLYGNGADLMKKLIF